MVQQHASVMAPIGGGQGGHGPTQHQSNPAEVPSPIKRVANGQLPVTKTCHSMQSYPSLMPSEQFQIQRVISMSQVDKVGKT